MILFGGCPVLPALLDSQLSACVFVCVCVCMHACTCLHICMCVSVLGLPAAEYTTSWCGMGMAPAPPPPPCISNILFFWALNCSPGSCRVLPWLLPQRPFARDFENIGC